MRISKMTEIQTNLKVFEWVIDMTHSLKLPDQNVKDESTLKPKQ